MTQVSLSAQHLVKRYGGVVALSDGNLDVHSGEVMTLVGANGSGKSTLSKIVTGVVAPDGGQLLLNEKEVNFSSPHAATVHGIVAVYQELSLIPRMTVAENIWLGHEIGSWNGMVRVRDMHERTRQLLDLFKDVIPDSITPDTPVTELHPSEKQIVEILKAFSIDPSVLILDEATASLDLRQVKRLFELVTEWKKRDMAIVFISHRLDEIYRVADRVTVLRNGRTMATGNIKDISRQELVNLMIEGGVVQRKVRDTIMQLGEERIRVENISTNLLKNIAFTVKSGELLGLGGLHGQGQSDLLLALFGSLSYTGKVLISQQEVILTSAQQAMNRDVAYVPGDRNNGGLLYIRSILENLQLPSWLRYGTPIRMGRARRDANDIAQGGLKLIMSGLDAPVSSLSGGNAQKVVIGKWLLRKPKILLLDDPTKGVDVGAKNEFYKLLTELQAEGTAILFYSSDDEELLGLCDRVLVLLDGMITGDLSGKSLNHSELMAASMGGSMEVTG